MLGSMMTRVGNKERRTIVPLTRKEFHVMNDPIDKLHTWIDSDCCIVNCIGAIPQKKYSDSEFRTINTDFPLALAAFCKAHHVPYIHISTNCVFSGKRANCLETDVADAEDVYGRSKLAGEPTGYGVVIRCSIIGPELGTHAGLMEWFLHTNASSVNGYADSFWNGVTTLELSNSIYARIDSRQFAHELVHVHSNTTVTKYELLCILQHVFNTRTTVVKTFNGLKHYTLTSHTSTPCKHIKEQIQDLYALGLAK
jgi:dTDP-4-dehydrorhamnose reductase